VPRETITLALSSLWPFQASAQFFGILVEPTDAEARCQLTLAEYHRQLRHDAETDPEGARKWQYWPPEYLLFDPALADKLHKRAMDILDRERMIAAERALVRLLHAPVKDVGGKGLELWENGEKLGPFNSDDFDLWLLRQQRILAGRPDDPDKVTVKTIEQRPWKHTKPVLHLAVAFLSRMRGKSSVERQAAWAALFNDAREAEALLDLAETLRHRLLAIAQRGYFQLREEQTLRLIAG
jgi:hypothetical protein